jgi:SAM-dependent methyltransferase
VLAVDAAGILLTGGGDLPLDVAFDGRRVWSFWSVRDTEPAGRGRRRAGWPTALRGHLDGHARLTVTAHGGAGPLYDDEVAFGDSTRRVTVVNRQGQPLGIDKSGKLVPTFETRTADQVAPLLDSVEVVLGELATAGIAAFPAYGTLLGAVREGRLIGHDSDADLGYVSRHTHPYDVVRESFALQRRLVDAGYPTSRYSAASFKVEVVEGDGFVRGLDVFGGFFGPSPDGGDLLYLMGEIRMPFRPEWIFPLGTCTLEGRTLPAPAEPERLLEAMYGPAWRVPDPAFRFTTPASTVRALNGYFRVSRARRDPWSRVHGARARQRLGTEPSRLAAHVVAEEGVPAQLLDVGAGRGRDALWFARQGSAVTAYDFLPGAAAGAVARAGKEGHRLESRLLNLQEWRSVLGEGARVSHLPGPRTVLANHLLDATTRFGRESLARFASLALRDGGRLYADFWCGGGGPDGTPTRPVPVPEVVAALRTQGAHILHAAELDDPEPGGDGDEAAGSGRRTGRVVAQWVRTTD